MKRTTMIALLRGVNVNGKNSIKMEVLRKVLSDNGLESVTTYIQSGNIVFQSNIQDEELVGGNIQKVIAKEFGHAIELMVLSLDQLQNIIQNQPFANDRSKDTTFFHVTFLNKTRETASDWEKLMLPNEAYVTVNKCIYFYCPNGYGNFKLTNSFVEKKLKCIATTRNWKTCLKLLEIAENLG